MAQPTNSNATPAQTIALRPTATLTLPGRVTVTAEFDDEDPTWVWVSVEWEGTRFDRGCARWDVESDRLVEPPFRLCLNPDKNQDAWDTLSAELAKALAEAAS